MPMSEAKKRANKKWNDENLAEKYDHIHLVLTKGYKTRINAARGGESLNGWIKGAIDAKLKESEKEG